MQRLPTGEASSRPACPEENLFFHLGVDTAHNWTLYIRSQIYYGQ